MKAKLFTKKQLKELKQVSTLGTQYLFTWTKTELKNYHDKPVVIPNGRYGFSVGKFAINGISKDCWQVTNTANKFVNNFADKKTAIVYCLYEVSKRYNFAQEILILDDKLSRLDDDIQNYQYIMTSNTNKFKKDIVLNRYIEAKLQRKYYNNILKKTLNLAKYMNFGT